MKEVLKNFLLLTRLKKDEEDGSRVDVDVDMVDVDDVDAVAPKKRFLLSSLSSLSCVGLLLLLPFSLVGRFFVQRRKQREFSVGASQPPSLPPPPQLPLPLLPFDQPR